MTDYAPVSVVIPCYNGIETLGRAVASAAGQTLPPAEIIVVDDASTDATPDLLSELAQDEPRLKVVRHETNHGPGAARNTGWAHARQHRIAFLDADDTWHEHKLAHQSRCMQATPSLAACGHAVAYLGDDGRPPAEEGKGAPRGRARGPRSIRRRHLLYRNQLEASSLMVRSDLAERFPTDRYRGEDFLFVLQLVCNGHALARLERTLTYKHRPSSGGSGLSGDMLAMQRAELDALHSLYLQGCLGAGVHALASIWSRIKYWRRLLRAARHPQGL